MSAVRALPVAIIGAGPVGLAAAAELLERGIDVKVYEAGPTAASNVRDWGHVRLFSPWRYNVAEGAVRLLTAHGWQAPDPDALPTGSDLYERYLEPLAALPELAHVIETGVRVKSIGRFGVDKVVSQGRESRPFVRSLATSKGIRRELARAVIDASGTWTTPNPLGADGSPADGEGAFPGRLAYGIPDVLGGDRDTYAGQTTLVVGGGHSAANALLDLDRLRRTVPDTTTLWAIRSTDLTRIFGGGHGDGLPARGELGADLRALIEVKRVGLIPGFSATAVSEANGRIIVEGETGDGPRRIGPVDRVIVATGQRPDLTLTRELRLELDPWLESTKALGPLIDPNVHWCGSVPPHGHRELSHPESGFYTLGIKSYGRAPTFLLLTGYEQARSVAAAIAGDMAAADDVRLVLPETGVCSVPAADASSNGCCGGPAPAAIEACCVADANAKAERKHGCGCKQAA